MLVQGGNGVNVSHGLTDIVGLATPLNPLTPTYYHLTMVKRKSKRAQERNLQLSEAVLGVQTGKFKSAYAAAKALGLCPNTVVACVNGGNTQQEACQKQQLLSKT